MLFLIALMLAPPGQATQVKCVFKYVPWPIIGNSYTCIVRDMNITQSKQSVTKVVGVHLSRMKDDRVRALDITRQTCFSLPLKLTTFFTNVELLQVHNSKLKTISQADLKPFTKLRVLLMHSNDLTSLEANLFNFNPLVKIDFRFQKLKLVDYNLLENLKQLSLADFSSSGCLDYDSRDGKVDIAILKKEIRVNCQPIEEIIKEIRSLKAGLAILEAEYANLHNAKAIVDLEKDPAMETINLKISQMQSENLKCLQNSEIITRNFLALMSKVDTIEKSLKITDGCAVNEVANEKCHLDMEELQRSVREVRSIEIECENVEWTKSQATCNALNLKVGQRDIEISKVRSGIQKFQPADIEELKVYNQFAIFLPLKIAENFPALKTLSFVNSGIVTLSESAFVGLHRLRNLNLPYNNIQAISKDTFYYLRELQILDLSYNKIDTLGSDVFQSLSELSVLKLNHNFLTKLDPQTFQGLKSLSVLILKANQLTSIPLRLFEPMKKLLFADFFGNKCVSTTWSRESTKTLDIIFKQICQ